jgi:hypothetical protein
MLRQEVYENTAQTFGVSVGVANIMGYTKLEDTKSEYTPKVYKKASDELDINMIINRVIELKKYKQFQRILHYTRKKTKHPRTKELTIYKKAWKELNGTH